MHGDGEGRTLIRALIFILGLTDGCVSMPAITHLEHDGHGIFNVHNDLTVRAVNT